MSYILLNNLLKSATKLADAMTELVNMEIRRRRAW